MGKSVQIRFSSVGILLLFLAINLILYAEHGVYASIIHILKAEGFLDWQVGFMASSFMFGSMIFSPLAAHLAQYVHPFNLITAGLSVSTLCYLVFSNWGNIFWIMVLVKILAGLGEATFYSLAPAILMEAAPQGQQTRYLGAFFSLLLVGIAVGLVFGQVITDAMGGWNWPFILLAGCMFILVVIMAFSYKDPRFLVNKLQNKDDASDEKMPLFQQIKILMGNTKFVLLTVGWAAHMFMVGGLSLWIKDYMIEHFEQDPLNASFFSSGIVVFNGLVANIIGPLINDKAISRIQEKYQLKDENIMKNIIVEQSLKFCCIWILLGLPIRLVGVMSDQFEIFITLYAMGMFLVLMQLGPFSVALLNLVPNQLRGQAVALKNFIQQLFGGFPAPIIAGIMMQEIGMYYTMMILIIYEFQAIVLWFIAYLLQHRMSAKVESKS